MSRKVGPLAEKAPAIKDVRRLVPDALQRGGERRRPHALAARRAQPLALWLGLRLGLGLWLGLRWCVLAAGLLPTVVEMQQPRLCRHGQAGSRG